jgi:hypothetical protein
MKTLQQQEIKAVSGGSDVVGQIDGDDSSYQRGRCQILLPTFVPQRNPIFLPPGRPPILSPPSGLTR